VIMCQFQCIYFRIHLCIC